MIKELSRMSADMHADDVSINCLLTLYLIDRSEGYVNDRIKLTKATFMSQKAMAEKNIQGYVLEFYRYKKGPFSKDLYEIKDVLVKNKLVHPDNYRLTRRGRRLLQDYRAVVEANPQVFGCIDEGLARVKGLDIDPLLEMVYSISMVPYEGGEERTISEMRMKTVILKNESYGSLRISEENLETIEIYRQDKLYSSMRASLRDLQKGRLCKCDMDELFCK